MTTVYPLALAIAILVSAPTVVHGHGRMTTPAVRSGNDNGCVAGGPGTVHAFGSSGEHQKYQHGICGNAPGTKQTFNAVKDVQATYTAGDTITIEIQITAHHVGYFEFDLCLDAGQLSEECFDQYHLLREGCECTCPDDPSNSCEECHECRWYWKALMQGEVSQSVANGYEGPVLPGMGNLVPYNYKMSYVLPTGVKSSNAVLRWHYMTTNSCTSGQAAPEEFWNCADIAIQDESGSTGPAISYDNEALESMAVPNLMPAIKSGALKGINYACPVDAAGDLLGVGTADEYHCGEAQDPGPFEYCTSASGSSGVFDCTGISSSAITCESECGVWYYQCAHMIAYMKPTATGTKCKDGRFVLSAACDGYQPSPTPSPADPTPAPASPTAAPASPTAAPASPTPAPASPTAAPASPTAAPPSPPGPGPDARCAEYSCTSCLANNNVCYGQPKSWCDLYPQYLWCGSSLVQTPPAVGRRSKKLRKLRGKGSVQPGDDSEENAMLQLPLEEGEDDMEDDEDEEVQDEL